jgi:hypothetical protein
MLPATKVSVDVNDPSTTSPVAALTSWNVVPVYVPVQVVPKDVHLGEITVSSMKSHFSP